jgi:methylene-tetrahydromethanopterin dehydrogenase
MLTFHMTTPMDRPYILHMFTPTAHMSPFDINMAADAGYQLVVPYGGVALDAIAGLTQDTIFSRGPKGVARTGIFIGGREVGLALDMLKQARAAMVKPFVVSVMADPSGAFTTAAAMVAAVEAALLNQGLPGLAGQRVLVLGGTGPVGRIAGVLAAQAGAQVWLSSRKGLAEAEQIASDTAARFGVTLRGAAAQDTTALAQADVLLACAAAGVQVVSAAELATATRLRVAADLNAVPPAGIAGVDAMDNAKPLHLGQAAVGLGALAVGNVKYQTQQRLLLQMRSAEKPVSLSFEQAFATAREVVAEKLAVQSAKPKT